MIQESKSEDGQVAGESVGVSKAPNSPKTSRAKWDALRLEYESGTWTSQRDLANKYGVNEKTLWARIRREAWDLRREELLRKAEKKVERVAVNQASEYLSSSFLRAKKYEKIIDASLENLGAKAPDGTPLIDPEAIDIFTRSEARIHELAKSSLRIPTVAQLDVTTKGESLLSALDKLRNNPQQIIDLSPEQVSRIAQLEVIPDDPK